MTHRDDDLPATFSAKEKAAFRWLYDVGVEGWMVDLLTHKVETVRHGRFDNLMEFVKRLKKGKS
jgi:hypothetical protein